jgi:alpha-glucosidase (family GH31 glycosyl hydrolase)
MLMWLVLCASLLATTVTGDSLLADPSTIVLEGQARFTILSTRLIRLEWSPTKEFVDARTWLVQSRQIQPTPTTPNVTRNDTHLRIDTGFVTIEYLRNAATTFSQHNIRVTVQVNPAKGETVVWNAIPGEEYDGNLLGTLRTLDGDRDSKLELDCRNQRRDDLHCTYGVISRRGYAVVDDTHHPQFDTDPQWPWIVNKNYLPPDPALCQAVPTAERRNCGSFNNTDQHECELRGCCYEGSSCFYASNSQQDLYLFGHGRAYSQALFEFTRLAGSIPLPPRYIFGVFFSRYWAYAEYEERQIITEYIQHDVPLDVLVTDMDWHITFYKLASNGTRDQAGQGIGWTGFTFDPHLYPNHQKFLQWCKQLGMKNTLNVHPASGIQPWEEKYKQMALAMGIDPSTGHYVPYNVTDKRYVKAWTSIVLNALQNDGIDLWWLDWQQGEEGWTNDIPYTNPTFWLNYIFFTDSYFGANRPALLHRWGGLGNHRYQVGFSGDVVPSWDTLSFQPRFTATAANVGYGFWSHDLGGHTQEPDPELYTRWLQWGAFSPMFRTHCTKNANNDRRLWTYPWTYQNNLARFTRLRQALIPYLYTAARRTYDSGISVVLPLYYRYPENDEAYSYSNQYFFGPNIFVSPISQPINNATGLVDNWPIWFPPDFQWVNFFTGDVPASSAPESFTLDEMPVYAQVGSIIPLLPEPKSSRDRIGRAQKIPQALLLYTLVGGSPKGRGYIYDDDGTTNAYQDPSRSTSAVTSFEYTTSGNTLQFSVSEATGSFPLFPSARSYEIHLRGVFPATNVLVNNVSIPVEPFNELINGQDGTTNGYTYDGSSLAVIIYIRQPVSTSQSLQIQVQLSQNVSNPLLLQSSTSFIGLLARCQSAKARLDYEWGVKTVYMDDYPLLLDAAATGLRITHLPSNATNEFNAFFTQRIPGACDEVANKITNLDPNLRSVLLAQLKCNTFIHK